MHLKEEEASPLTSVSLQEGRNWSRRGWKTDAFLLLRSSSLCRLALYRAPGRHCPVGERGVDRGHLREGSWMPSLNKEGKQQRHRS
jgi:hypothetical protein